VGSVDKWAVGELEESVYVVTAAEVHHVYIPRQHGIGVMGQFQ